MNTPVPPPQPAPQQEWMTREEVADFLRICTRSVDRNRVLWTDKAPTRGKYRYKMMQIGASPVPRIWRVDVLACFFVPGQ